MASVWAPRPARQIRRLEGCGIVYEAISRTQYNAFPFYLLAPFLMPSQSLSGETLDRPSKRLSTFTSNTNQFNPIKKKVCLLN